jgi:hypothetical protein
MYYRLSSDLAGANVFVRETSHEFTSLTDGVVLPADTPVPFEFEMEVDRDAAGARAEPRMDAFFPNVSLMHRSLVEAMAAAGADNLQTFPAVVLDGESGRRYEDYVVANVVGLVSCADMEASESEPLADLHFFHDLVIDPRRAAGRAVFRLAESTIDVIVQERVAAALDRRAFTGLVLEPLREAGASGGPRKGTGSSS